MALRWLFGGNDRDLAATTYAGRESASDKATRKAATRSARNRAGHRNGGAARAAAKGQAWEDQQRNFGGRS